MQLSRMFITALLGTAFVVGAPIPGLFNTGTDGGNMVLAGGNGILEIHYTVASFNPVTFTHPLYFANDANSRWISSGGNNDGDPGVYARPFRLTFDLTGLIPSTARITGLWGTDNCGTINLNGSPTGDEISGGCATDMSHFTGLQAFTISSGFVAGINHLDFVLENAGGPGALRVDDIAGAALEEVPEPATIGLLGAGLLALGFLRRKL